MPYAKAHLDAIFEAKRQSDNADDERVKWEKRYNGAKAAVDTLLAAWTSNEAFIKDNTWDVANTVAATVISLILEEVLTDDPGDGGAMKNGWFKGWGWFTRDHVKVGGEYDESSLSASSTSYIWKRDKKGWGLVSEGPVLLALNNIKRNRWQTICK